MTNLRKHVTQMTDAERMAVESYAHNLGSYRVDNAHLAERRRKWNLSDIDIINALRYGTVVEAHANNWPDIRFVLRHNKGNRAVCVCANLRGEVITVWANNTGDNHRTLDRSQYQWKENLMNVFGTTKVAQNTLDK